MDDKMEIEVEGENTQVEVVEEPQTTVEADIPEDEIAQYSAKVQKRIQQLTAARHDERRGKEDAIREREAALAYAKQIADENAKMKELLSKGETTLLKTMQAATEKELEDFKAKYKEALYTGDADKIASAQENFSRAIMRAERAKSIRQETPVEQQAEPQPVDKRAEKWKNDNKWFGQEGQPGVDDEMTHFAMGVHKKLVRERGQMYAATDEYYERIDARMREKFPEYFGQQGEHKRSATVVTPTSRSVPSKKIRITASEANMAKRLGVPLEEYAKNVAKLREQGKL